MKPVVFFYVQHLWGVGHVYRATRVARGLSENGFDVHLIWGGTKIDNFDFGDVHVHYLTSVRSQGVDFKALVHEDYKEFSSQDEEKRRDHLLALLNEIQPDILITEAYPFGRRQMRFELIPLLETAKAMQPKPMIVSSIRDIMQENRKGKRATESVQLVEDYYDLILVHGDENLITIEDTLQGASHFLDIVRYTGLVVPEVQEKSSTNKYACDVLVSVGGGAFGQKLTQIVLKAMPLSKKYPRNWLLSVGTERSDDEFEDVSTSAPEDMRVVRYIPNLAGAMMHTKVSVSFAGYNTVGDILQSKCASVLVPYMQGGESEQLRRANMLHDHKLALGLFDETLDAEALARAVDEAADFKRSDVQIKMNGAKMSAEILANEFAKYRTLISIF